MTYESASTFVSRTASPRLLATKSRAARAVAQKSGLFEVPRVLDVDEATGTVTFERISGLRPLSNLTGLGNLPGQNACGALGRSLAVIHRCLRLPHDEARALPSPWVKEDEPLVWVHGDLTAANVCCIGDTGRLVIVDWATAATLGERLTVASRYFDVVWFVAHLFYGLPLRRSPALNPAPLARCFLAAYIEESAYEHHQAGLDHCMREIHTLYPTIVAQRVAAAPPALRIVARRLHAQRYRKWLDFVHSYNAGAVVDLRDFDRADVNS